jgi:hypothetical protein
MITLEQIQILDKKIKDAIDLINRLRVEKKILHEKIVGHEQTIALLEEELSSCKNDSDQIEEGFNNVLSQLDLVDNKDAQPGQQVEATIEIQPQSDHEDDGIDEESETETVEEEEPDEDFSLDVEEDEVSEEDSITEIIEDSTQENMQFEINEDDAANDSASEEPDIDKGIPLTPDATIIDDDMPEESQVNHSEQQENEDSRSPQDLDIF